MPKPKERVNGVALGLWIKRQRALRNLTQADVAAASGKPQGQIAKLENGQRATVPREDVAAYARGVRATEAAAMRAIAAGSAISAPVADVDEEAMAIAESYAAYTSPQAREIIRRALQYADAVEDGFASARVLNHRE